MSQADQYTYDNTKIEVTGGMAQLKGSHLPGTDWIATDSSTHTDWGYRRAITINNSSNTNTLTNYQVKLDESLLGYWKMDEASGSAVADFSGNGYNGTISSAPAIIDGKFGKARTFDNIDDGVDITGNNFAGTGDYTVSCWVFINGTHKNYTGTILSSGNWNTRHWGIGISQANNAIQFRGMGADKNYSFSTGQWYHIAATRSGSTQTVFVNNVSLGSDTVTAAPFDSDATDTMIGRETYAGGYFDFNGAIDEVRYMDEHFRLVRYPRFIPRMPLVFLEQCTVQRKVMVVTFDLLIAMVRRQLITG
jgi:hypothetical protein